MRKDLLHQILLTLLAPATLLFLVAKLAPGQRILREGDTWLGWTPEVRQEYVWGFSAGYSEGYENSCRFMYGIWQGPKSSDKSGDPLDKCFASETMLSRGAPYYADAVTRFYKRYPNDHNIMIGEILEKLAQGMTLQQIHEYPFPRR